MIRSMTGFGRSESVINGREITVILNLTAVPQEATAF